MKKEEVKKVVREGYARIARQGSSGGTPVTSCCGPAAPCCGGGVGLAEKTSKSIGYSDEELQAVPEGANLGLGCGNPVALASLKKGETVLDLGSGAGLDCFLAAKKVGKTGKVIGVDMTPEMLHKARENARKGGYGNVEFRLGEIENLPVADDSVDVVISNCVINLSPDKKRVFEEAYRVLKPGGRLMISDIVLLKPLPAPIRDSIEAYIGCLSGAMLKAECLSAIRAAGFHRLKTVSEAPFPMESLANDPTAQGVIDNCGITPEVIKGFASSVISLKLSAVKPK